MMAQQTKAPLCKCGCGKKVVQSKKFPGNWNTHILGHHNMVDGCIRRRIGSKGIKAPLCKCGCGQKVSWDKRYWRWYTYLVGHNMKGKLKSNAKCRPPIGENPPLCACGCGDTVKWNKGGYWGKYFSKHQSKNISIETRKRMSIASKKRFENPEERRRLSESLKGKHPSQETRKKTSKARKGKPFENRRVFKKTGLNPKQYSKFKQKRECEILSDHYVKGKLCCARLGLQHADIPDELVAAKREHLRLGRLLKGL